MARAAVKQLGYQRLNSKYLREADELRARGALPQASGKLWGAAAEIVKAVAAKRGLMLGTHRSLAEYVERLQQEKTRWDLIIPFQVAAALHTNFYENHLPEQTIRRSAEVVKDFVEKLRSLL